MKNLYITIIVIAFYSFNASSQIVTTHLDANNVSATITNQGTFFNNINTQTPGYEVPKGSGKNVINTAGLWFGGRDANGQLKLAAQHYYTPSEFDFWPGPVTRYNPWEWQSTPGITDYFGQTVWTVTKAEIDYHIANYQSISYTIPPDIANWPAHGDTTIGTNGMLPYIAPFVDANNNGYYDPDLGDYPCIKGDQTTYVILNDAGLHTASEAVPVGMELHYMFYQYNSIPALENTTFVDVEILNMDTQLLEDFVASFYLDTDIGNPMDDFVGTDTIRNMVFAYNGDIFDEDNGGHPGYGNDPPAVGIKLLSHPLDYSMSYLNTSYPYSAPQLPLEYYNMMKGKWRDGSAQIDNNSNPTNYFYTGDPNTPNSWSENNLGNVSGDRRILASTNLGYLLPDMSIGAANRTRISYAIVFGQGTDNLNSVDKLKLSADFVQDFYENNSTNCFDYSTAEIIEQKDFQYNIKPNPNNGNFTIELPDDISKGTIELKDVSGRSIMSRNFNNEKTINIQTNQPSGFYFVTITTNGIHSTQRLVIE